MSFHWNLSSEDELEGEEDEEEELREFDQPKRGPAVQPPAPGSSSPKETTVLPIAVSAAAVATVTPCTDEHMFSDDDDDEVDWEDAADEEEVFSEEEDSKPAAAPLRPVTINIGKRKLDDDKYSKNKKKPKRTRTRKIYRNKSLSPEVGQLLRNLHKAHLLTLSSRAVMISECCSNEDLLHLSHSLISLDIDTSTNVPSIDQVKKLCIWYFNFVNRVDQRRRARLRSNAAAGASMGRKRGRKQTAHGKSRQYYAPPPKINGHGTATPLGLMQMCSYLSSLNDENPQLDEDTGNYRITSLDKVQLLVAMARSLGWRARYVVSLDPMSQDFDVNHPMFFFGTVANVFDAVYKKSSKRAKHVKQQIPEALPHVVEERPSDGIVAWVEILCQGGRNKMKWTHVDVEHEWIDQPRSVESLIYSKKNNVNLNLKRHTHITYALGVEHLVKETDNTVFRLTDVTPRYANSWSKSQRLRGDGCNAWFSETIREFNVAGGTTSQKKQRHVSSGKNEAEAIAVEESDEEANQEATPAQTGDEVEEAEKAELFESAAKETMPTSKAGFKNHAAYALLSQLGTYEVLDPKAKKSVCGMFKGEFVHHRSDISTAKVAKKWLYEGRKVKDGEQPIKRVKARKKATPKMFRQLDSYGVGASNDGSEDFRQRQIEVGSAPESDGKEDIFAFWQTSSWSPAYVGPNDDIPVNAYRNIELALLNPGLVHMNRPRMAQVAKKLGIPYAPCLLGFEGHGGNRTPSIRGIAVHQHSVHILDEAFAEFESHAIELEHRTRKENALKRWKKLIHGVLLKDRLHTEYGEGNGEDL